MGPEKSRRTTTPISAALTPTVAHAAELARLVNDSLHGIATDHPARFGWLARVPLLDVDDAVAEIERMYDQLHPDGVLLTTHNGDRLLGDQAFDPVMDALHARDAVVLVHPDAPPDLCPGSLPPFVVDEPTDITRAAVSLTMSGTLDRYPAIRWILADDSGGAFPYLAGRLTAGRGLGYGADPVTVRAAVQRFSYDTTGPMSPYATPTPCSPPPGLGLGLGLGRFSMARTPTPCPRPPSRTASRSCVPTRRWTRSPGRRSPAATRYACSPPSTGGSPRPGPDRTEHRPRPGPGRPP